MSEEDDRMISKVKCCLRSVAKGAKTGVLLMEEDNILCFMRLFLMKEHEL